ncbi:pyruvate formate lyase family protein, partial [Cloacibacillus evryensis]|uniref:pyruvate formate lyase family protein n=1 Tax=Cloacibacillus evryensis TaxID=508460 RepID=UPI002730CB8C
MIPYNVSDETKDLYKNEIIPYWRGRSLRDRVFGRLEREWMDIYESGLITETLEQRAPGSMALDGKIYGTGLLGIKEEIMSAAAALDFMNDPEASDKREELTAMDIA